MTLEPKQRGNHMDKKEKEIKIILSPEVQAAMDEDPDKAKMIKDFMAACHQAVHGVKTGKYKTHEEGLAAITGGKITHISEDDL